MTTTFLIVAVVVFPLLWYLLKYFLRQPYFLSKPHDKQARWQRQLHKEFYVSLALSVAASFISGSKTTGVIPWLVSIIYLSMWIGGGYMFWNAFRIGVQKNTSGLRKSNDELFQEPQRVTTAIVITEISCGLPLWIIAILVPVVKIDPSCWLPLIILFVGIRKWGYLMQEKNDEV